MNEEHDQQTRYFQKREYAMQVIRGLVDFHVNLSYPTM